MTKKEFEDIIRPLVLLPSGQRKLLKEKLLKNFEKWQEEAITVTHFCKSDSEQLCGENDYGKIVAVHRYENGEWVEYNRQ